VLKGAEGLLRRYRPTLLVECEERHNPGGTKRLFDYLDGLNYQGRFLKNDRMHDIAQFDPIANQKFADQPWTDSNPYTYNFFFFPVTPPD
jgi:hypothetical protein